jgi:hypothetical protein
MKLDPLDAHDRLLHLHKEQSNTIAQGASDCLKTNPLSLALQEHSPYVYIFGHPRTEPDGSTKRMLWQPRLTKPEAQTNSYLFRAISKTDLLEIIWILPPRELWSQYEEGKVCASEEVRTSINNFLHYRAELNQPHPEDLSDDQILKIRQTIAMTLGMR